MNENRTLESIFNDAIEIESPNEREAYLNAVCGGNSELRGQVDRLLRAHFRTGRILDSSPHEIKAEPNGSLIEKVGDVVGPYKLLELIGEGGMGLVYMAEQQRPVSRKVALKIIKPGMDSRQVIARFEAEQQALALMDHNNVARVFDANTTESGRPYFVMELVKGIPITEYCDKHKLNLAERLNLFQPVCQAIQHAHQKGVIHRDIKPTNILVARYDSQPLPKVIDFGIAKAVGQKLTDRTMFTGMGQILGTFEYMSPEQAQMNQRDIDTRSDVYSLGVVLYELLTGSKPITKEQLRDVGFEEMLRVVRKTDPPRPSTRLSESRDAIHSIAADRRTEPGELSNLIRGDLDWIVMKALEKQREQRYETASGLARDIQRYLANEPIEARPRSTGYYLHKFVTRHRRVLAVAAGFAIVLGLGIAVSAWQSVRAYRADLRADADRERTQMMEAARAKEQRLFYFKQILLADRERQANNVILARRRLDECPEHLRGWEWNYLDHVCHQELVSLDHQFPVGSVDISPNGQLLATGSSDGKSGHVIRIYDMATHQFRALTGHSMPIQDLSFTLDSSRIVSSASWGVEQETGEIKVWDVKSGKLLADLPNVTHSVGAISVSPDGVHIAVANGFFAPPGVVIWNLEELEHVRVLNGVTGPFFDVAYSRDGERIVTGGVTEPSLSRYQPGEFCIWNVKTGDKMFQKTTNVPIVAIACSDDGETVASSGSDSTIRFWDATTGEEKSYLPGHAQAVYCMEFVSNGLLASAGVDCSIKLWRSLDGRGSTTLRGHGDAVFSLAGHPDGSLIASSSDDGTVKLWDTSDDDAFTLRGHGKEEVGAVAFSPNGELLVSKGKSLRIWNLDGLMIHASKPELFGRDLHDLALSPDGELLAVASRKNTIIVLEAPTGRKLYETKDRHNGIITALDFSPDGSRLASMSRRRNLSETGEIRTWDARSGNPILRFTGHRTLTHHRGCIKYSVDGERLVTVCTENVIRVWDAETGQQLHVLEGHLAPILSIAVSPDARTFATSAIDNDIKLWDLNTGEAVRTFRGHTQDVDNVAFSSDGKRLVSGSHDTLVKLWDLDTGDEIISLRGNTGTALGLAFSPDGQHIASGGQDGNVRIWSAHRVTPDQRSRRRAARLVNELAQELTRDEVIAAIRADARLDDRTRRHALGFAVQYQDGIGPTVSR